MNNNWSAFTDFESVKRRPGGRRHYNSVRKLRAQVRKLEAGILLLKGMKKADIARQLDSHGTISRLVPSVGLLFAMVALHVIYQGCSYADFPAF